MHLRTLINNALWTYAVGPLNKPSDDVFQVAGAASPRTGPRHLSVRTRPHPRQSAGGCRPPTTPGRRPYPDAASDAGRCHSAPASVVRTDSTATATEDAGRPRSDPR